MTVKSSLFLSVILFIIFQPLCSDSLNFTPVDFQRDRYLHSDASTEWLYFYAYLHDDSTGEDISYTSIFTSDKESQVTLQAADSVSGSVYQYSANSIALKKNALIFKKNKNYYDSVFIDSSIIRIVSKNKEMKCNLEFMPVQKMILLNDSGCMSISPSFSYYYSLPRMSVKGYITISNEKHPVSGVGWHDHQWGDFLVGSNPYTWFSIMFEDGRNAVIWKFRDEALGHINLFEEDTSCHDTPYCGEPLKSNDLFIRRLSYKKAPDSDKVFPYGWFITSDSLKMQVLISPKFANFHLSYKNASLYQGPCDVYGVIDGQKLSGLSHMELTFFDDYYSQGKFLVNYKDSVYSDIVNSFKMKIDKACGDCNY